MSDDKAKIFQFPRGLGDNRGRLLASASWLHNIEPYQPGMIWLGRDAEGNAVGTKDDRHIYANAGNRGGKGTGLIIPNLCLWPGSAVVIDPKGENAAITARNRAMLEGHQVIALDPFNEANLPSDLIGSFNPLDLIDIESDEAIDIAGMIIKANNRDMHWDESARDLITGLILHVCDTEDPEARNLGLVRQLLTQGDSLFRDAMIAAEEAAADEDDDQ